MQSLRCLFRQTPSTSSLSSKSIPILLTIRLQQRGVFGFSPTSKPEGLEGYELLFRDFQKESEEALRILRQYGYSELVSLRNIDDYPLSKKEIKELRYKLKLPFDSWIDPPLFEEERKQQECIDKFAQQIVDGYRNRGSNPKPRGSNSIHNRVFNEGDKYSVLTPIFYHKKEDRAIMARPADKLITIIKPSKKQLDQSHYGEEDKRYQVLGTQWYKGGSKYYDADDGMDWSHINWRKYNSKQEKVFSDWREWGELEYHDENIPKDPNDMDSFYYRTPKVDKRDRHGR